MMEAIKGIEFEKCEAGNFFETSIDEIMAKRILEKNQGYIKWSDGSSITKEELINDFIVYYFPYYSKKPFFLTMKNRDFYIDDIEI